MLTGLALARWALYVDLAVAFGVPAAACLTGARFALTGLRWALVLACLAGLVLAVLGYLFLVAAMAGSDLADLDGALATDLATQTGLGWAFLVRLTALALAMALWIGSPRRAGVGAMIAGIAVVSLAFSGHAAAGEGAVGLFWQGLHVLHALAASIWIGALVLFVAMLFGRSLPPVRITQVLERFGGLGSVLVAILIATGLVNLLFLMPLSAWPSLIATVYGRILITKLMLFATILGLAALNRFRLVPRRSITGLRASVAIEWSAGLAVLLCVGIMGTLDPTALPGRRDSNHMIEIIDFIF